MVDVLTELNRLIEGHKLWSEMGEHIFALGGEIWETKYAEAYNFHEELVYNLIVKERGFTSLSDEEDFDLFREAIYDLSHGHCTKLYDVKTNECIGTIFSGKDLYHYLMNVVPLKNLS